MVLANVNAEQSSFHHTVMNAMSATMATQNVNCVIATPMELMEMYVRQAVASVLAKRITEGKTAIDAKKSITDFQIAYVSAETSVYISFINEDIECFKSPEQK